MQGRTALFRVARKCLLPRVSFALPVLTSSVGLDSLVSSSRATFEVTFAVVMVFNEGADERET